MTITFQYVFKIQDERNNNTVLIRLRNFIHAIKHPRGEHNPIDFQAAILDFEVTEFKCGATKVIPLVGYPTLRVYSHGKLLPLADKSSQDS